MIDSYFSRIISTFCLAGATMLLQAQTDEINAIKNNPAYYSCEGYGVTLDDANKNAKARLIESIKTTISSERERTVQTTSGANGTVINEQTETSISSYSYMSLRNIESVIVKDEPDAEVFMWISKAEVAKMQQERIDKIKDYVNTGKAAEKNLQIDDALRNYYWAFMLTKAGKDNNIMCEFDGEERNCLAFLPTKINSVIAQMKVGLEGCEYRDNRYYAKLHFTYNGRDVASVQFKYNDGQALEGPVAARDGIAEVEMLSMPADGKIRIRYEYIFRNEAETMSDEELKTVFKDLSTVPMKAMAEIPVKVNPSKRTMVMKPGNDAATNSVATNDMVKPELTEEKEMKKMETVSASEGYMKTMAAIENAIKNRNPEPAFSLFTPEGYEMFRTLIKETGKVSLVGAKQNYEFVKANGFIVARSCKVKIKYSNGKTFMENLVFRFNENTGKIESLAYGLTKKAETDIFNAASQWPDISRFTIQQFMEDYQTAYNLKRYDYLDKVFSEDALIIYGTVLKKAEPTVSDGKRLDLGTKNVSYQVQTKKQYLDRLKTLFRPENFIHLTFEDNRTKVINAPRIPKATAFAIQIKQIYYSPTYADTGYLTLVLDASQEQPIIHVRLWQPETSEFVDLEDFINKFKF